MSNETQLAGDLDPRKTTLATAPQTYLAGAPEPEAKAPDPGHPPHLLLPRNLGAVAKLANKDPHARYFATTAVQLEQMGPQYRATATDGKRLITVTGTSENPETYPWQGIPALAHADNGATIAHISARDWQAAFKTIPTRCRPGLEHVAVTMAENSVTMATTDLERSNVQTPRNVAGRFPDWQRVFPTSKPVVTIRIDPKLLAETLTTVATFTDAEAPAVSLIVYPKGAPVEIQAKNADGQTTRALVVPLTADKPVTQGKEPIKAHPYEFWRALDRLAGRARLAFLKHQTEQLATIETELHALLKEHNL
jgi:hypothetical protein